MQARHEAIDNGFGDEVESGDSGEDGRIEEALLHEELFAHGTRLLTLAA